MIKLTPAQKESLAALYRESKEELKWVHFDYIYATRMSAKGRKSNGGYSRSTKAALEQLAALIPRLVTREADPDKWRLTLAGQVVARVQLGLGKKQQMTDNRSPRR